VPTLPLGSDVVVIDSVALIVMLRFAVADCAGELESVTLAVKLNVPDCVGVPETCPVLAFRLSPFGSLPALIENA
jgi:hypothetical protein